MDEVVSYGLKSRGVMLDLFHTPYDILRRVATLAVVLIGWIGAAALPVYSQAGQESSSQGGLTVEYRIGCQRAIDEVYWSHRIWPKQNGRGKPDLEEVMPEAAIRGKVEDYLGKSRALAVYWRRPITGEQLQAEMDRMARRTKQPAVLKELWAALGNDPYVIAECLVRPVLANRLLRNSYAYDGRYHGELRALAEAQLKAYGSASQMRQMSGEYHETKWVKGEGRRSETAVTGEVTLNPDLWAMKLSELLQLFNVRGTDEPTLSGQMEPLHPLAAYSGIFPSIAHRGLELLAGRRRPVLRDGGPGEGIRGIKSGDGGMEEAGFRRVVEAPARGEARAAPTGPSYAYRLPVIDSECGTHVDDTWQPTLAAVVSARILRPIPGWQPARAMPLPRAIRTRQSGREAK